VTSFNEFSLATYQHSTRHSSSPTAAQLHSNPSALRLTCIALAALYENTQHLNTAQTLPTPLHLRLTCMAPAALHHATAHGQLLKTTSHKPTLSLGCPAAHLHSPCCTAAAHTALHPHLLLHQGTAHTHTLHNLTPSTTLPCLQITSGCIATERSPECCKNSLSHCLILQAHLQFSSTGLRLTCIAPAALQQRKRTRINICCCHSPPLPTLQPLQIEHCSSSHECAAVEV
jgi:hypothetical protein